MLTFEISTEEDSKETVLVIDEHMRLPFWFGEFRNSDYAAKLITDYMGYEKEAYDLAGIIRDYLIDHDYLIA